MQFKQLFDDDRAVSPVIGVILMVAITVILAAVIGTFVLGLGDQVKNTTPSVSFGFDTSNDKKNVTVTHQSGDSIEASNLNITATRTFTNADVVGDTANSSKSYVNMSGSGDVTAGTSVEIHAGSAGGTESFAGETIRVVYDNPNNDKTATLGKREVAS